MFTRFVYLVVALCVLPTSTGRLWSADSAENASAEAAEHPANPSYWLPLDQTDADTDADTDERPVGVDPLAFQDKNASNEDSGPSHVRWASTTETFLSMDAEPNAPAFLSNSHDGPITYAMITDGSTAPTATTAPGCGVGCATDCSTCRSSDACITDSCLTDCCEDVWTFSAGMIFLDRSNSTHATLVTDQNTGDEVLNTRDFNFDYRAAPWFALNKQCTNCWGWGLEYIGLESWHENAQRMGSFITNLPGGIPVPATGPGTVIDAHYGTDFHSTELNVRHRHHDCVTLLAGFRWVELSDTLSIRELNPSRHLLTVDANNHLYGFQLGADSELLIHDRWSLSGRMRAGIFYNHSDQSTFAPVLTGINGVVDAVGARDDHTAFLGEIGLQGAYALTCNLSITAGYRLYWLEGVTLAPNQLATTSLIAPGAAEIANGGSLLLDGATIGFNWTF